MDIKGTLKFLQSYIFLTAGLALAAIGWAGFIIPSNIIGGGVTGIATILHFSTGLDIGISTLLMNIVLILLAIKIVGLSFGVKTIYGITVFSIFLSITGMVVTEPLVSEKIMATFTGSILAGAGVGIAFLNGGSTGGSDIIAMIINKYRDITLGRLLLYVDAIIVSSSFFLFKSIETMIYGFIMISILAYTVDAVISGTKQTVQFFILSKNYDELKDEIILKTERGVTVIPGEGGYTGNQVKVLMVIARKSESQIILKTIKNKDPKAFITMSSVVGVYGQGFDPIKI
ncbi:YitT family protein [Marinilabiliaceae bacterium ANBcel2]|nr:YitT family protein [Marinilabiliaceae bacterium ANBcel2]